jgi:CheY-like chemotaxis protein
MEEAKKKILLIDDDASLLLTLSDFLTFEGYDVTTADCGEKGLKKLTKMTPDLIILDMSMPGIGGVGFLKEISSPDGKPKYPVLVLTARANMAEFFANVAVDGFVAKPCNPDDLLMEVSRIVFLRSGGTRPVSGIAVEKKTILIAEDDKVAVERLAGSLENEGYIVERAYAGPEAVEKAVVLKPDIILLKLMLSGMNGDAVARMLKDMPSTKDVPVILYDEADNKVPENKFAGPSSGVRRFVRRSTAASLLEAVGEVLG